MNAHRAAAFAASGLLAACAQMDPSPRPPPPAASAPQASPAPDLDESATLARIANSAYRFSPQFVPINRESYESIAASGTRVNVWVSAGDAPSYERISPDRSGSRVNLTPGAVIVREVIQQGVTVKLTVIVKGPSGYNPDIGDMWFAVTEPNGTPLVQNGVPVMGRLAQCATCHSLRWEDGFLFGVPRDRRATDGDDAGAPTDASLADAAPPTGGSTAPPATSPPRDVCGDFLCTAGESCLTCTSDCGPCDDHGGDDHGGSSSSGPGP